MLDEILNPNTWQPFDVEKQLDFTKEYNNRPKKGKPNYWNNTSAVLSPLALYKYLKSRFGRPNGFITMLKNNTSDNLIHWHYSLHVSGAVIDIMGKTSGLEIVIKTKEQIKLKSKDWQKLIENLQNGFKIHGKQMSLAQSNFEHWSLFINPFTRIEHTIQEYLNKLIKLDLTEPRSYKIGSKKDFNKYIKEMNVWVNNISDAAALGTTIRMLCPVMAESFINLILLVFRKDEYKNDERLYDNLIRQQIDIRVKTLHLHCTCFPKIIDSSTDAFKNFHTLMNKRNDFLHGNIDPSKLVIEDVWFDEKTIPIFKDDEGFMKKMLKNYCTNVEREKAIGDFETISKLIELVLMSMDDISLKLFVQIMSNRMPGINKKTKRLGVLFPDHLAEGYVTI